MPCYYPLIGYQEDIPNSNGKRPVVFKRPSGSFTLINVPCGQCVGCRLERSRQWAMRCMHEASLYDQNTFLTLTYRDSSLPNDNNLKKSDLQKFWKRLRKRFPETTLRYYACGEYGKKCIEHEVDDCEICRFGRPHYHACVFNLDFLDKKFYKHNKNGDKLYISQVAEDIWEHGYVVLGDVTFESAAYTARYIMKKVTGNDEEEHYTIFDHETGEVLRNVTPEFTVMSRRPGIGREWINRYTSDTYPSDTVIVRGRECRPPRYYDSVVEVIDPEEYEEVKKERIKKLESIDKDELGWKRMHTKEEVAKAKVAQLKRTI